MSAPFTPAAAYAYLLAAEGMALMRLIASRASATVVTRANALFVSTFNEHAAEIGEFVRSAAVPALPGSIQLLPWNGTAASVFWRVIEALDAGHYCALTAEGYTTLPSRSGTAAQLVADSSGLNAILSRVMNCVSNDRDPLYQLEADIRALVGASSFDQNALAARVAVAFQRLTGAVPAVTPAADTVADSRKLQDRNPSGEPPILLDINDPNSLRFQAQRPGRETAIPAAVWVLGAGVLVGGIGLLVLRKRRAA